MLSLEILSFIIYCISNLIFILPALLKGTTIVMLSLDGKVGENLIPRTKFNITMKTINPEVKIVPQNCYVSSSPNPNYPFKHYIIRDR